MFFLLRPFLLWSFTDSFAAIVFGCFSLWLSNYLDFLFFFFGCIVSAASDTAPRAGTGAVLLCKKFENVVQKVETFQQGKGTVWELVAMAVLLLLGVLKMAMYLLEGWSMKMLLKKEL